MRLACIVMALFAAAAPAMAQQREMTFTKEVSVEGAWRIKAEGMITGDTARRFDEYVAAQDNIESLQAVYLNSDGGSLEGGMALGRAIHRMRIGAQIDLEARCLSACAYAFLGGRFRDLVTLYGQELGATQDRLGFHSFTYDDSRITGLTREQRDVVTGVITSDVQTMTSRLSNYVASMGISTETVVRSADIPRGEFLFFTTQELTDLGILTARGTDITDFQLIPDGATLLAVARHENHQFILACRTSASGARKPVVVFTQAVAASAAELPEELPQPIRLSHISGIAKLPWAQRDLEHGHFHAHEWLIPADFNQVFDDFEFGVFNSDGEELEAEKVELSAANAEFRVEPGFFHGLVELPVAMARRIAGATNFSLWFSETSSGSEMSQYRWGHGFESQPLEREVIRTALAPCL